MSRELALEALQNGSIAQWKEVVDGTEIIDLTNVPELSFPNGFTSFYLKNNLVFDLSGSTITSDFQLRYKNPIKVIANEDTIFKCGFNVAKLTNGTSLKGATFEQEFNYSGDVQNLDLSQCLFKKAVELTCFRQTASIILDECTFASSITIIHRVSGLGNGLKVVKSKNLTVGGKARFENIVFLGVISFENSIFKDEVENTI